MISVQQVAGATQYNGTSGLGLVTFDQNMSGDQAFDPESQVVPVITTIGYTTSVAHDWTLQLVDPNDSSNVVVLSDQTGQDTLTEACGKGGIVVPNSGVAYYELQFSTSGKTAAGSLVVHWYKGALG